MPKKVYLNDMKISSDLNKVSFKSAIVNINAVSDTHGELAMANNALETMRNLNKDIFVKEGKGKKNIFNTTVSLTEIQRKDFLPILKSL